MHVERVEFAFPETSVRGAHCTLALVLMLTFTLISTVRADAQVILDMPPTPALRVDPQVVQEHQAKDTDSEAAAEVIARSGEALRQHREHQLATGRLALRRYVGARSYPQRHWHPSAHVAAYQSQFAIFGHSRGFFTPHGLSPHFAHPMHFAHPFHFGQFGHGCTFWHWHPNWWFVGTGFFAPHVVVIPPRHGITVRFKTKR